MLTLYFENSTSVIIKLVGSGQHFARDRWSQKINPWTPLNYKTNYLVQIFFKSLHVQSSTSHFSTATSNQAGQTPQ